MSNVADIIAKALPNSRRILVMWDRLGGPPGNGYREATDIEQATSIIAALDAAGFVMAPKEPSERMMETALPYFVAPWRYSAYAAYRAMVEARPK